MERVEANPKALVWPVCGAAAAPFVVASTYLFLTRLPRVGFSTFSDYAGLAVSVFAGAVFLALLPIPRLFRVLSLLAYVPLVAVVLFFYTFWFLSAVFHEGL
jgi:hypothetical protein